MAADKYGMSILAMKLKLQQRRQEQQRQEALQREQMNNQREAQGLDMIIKSGQTYFNAMKAADDRDLKFAIAQHQQRMNIAEREREDLKARTDAKAKLDAAAAALKGQETLQKGRQKFFLEPRTIAAKKEVATAAARASIPGKDLGSQYKAAGASRDDLARAIKESISDVNSKIKAQEKFGGFTMDRRMAGWYAKLEALERMKGRINGVIIKYSDESVSAAQAEMARISQAYSEELGAARRDISGAAGIRPEAPTGTAFGEEASTSEAATVAGWSSMKDKPITSTPGE